MVGVLLNDDLEGEVRSPRDVSDERQSGGACDAWVKDEVIDDPSFAASASSFRGGLDDPSQQTSPPFVLNLVRSAVEISHQDEGLFPQVCMYLPEGFPIDSLVAVVTVAAEVCGDKNDRVSLEPDLDRCPVLGALIPEVLAAMFQHERLYMQVMRPRNCNSSLCPVGCAEGIGRGGASVPLAVFLPQRFIAVFAQMGFNQRRYAVPVPLFEPLLGLETTGSDIGVQDGCLLCGIAVRAAVGWPRCNGLEGFVVSRVVVNFHPSEGHSCLVGRKVVSQFDWKPNLGDGESLPTPGRGVVQD